MGQYYQILYDREGPSLSSLVCCLLHFLVAVTDSSFREIQPSPGSYVCKLLFRLFSVPLSDYDLNLHSALAA